MQLAEVPTGIIKTFGPFGILYQVGKPDKALPDGDILVNITLIESGEQQKYRLSKLLNDPNAE
ncbi:MULTISPECIES: DUF5397 family protein [Avibacterium]|uniref:DUF5397 family protein n=1 Tax=Avibacterium TaxID=292486 RepID=UPI0022464894|nr:DUF5397 family protein [Avibacterium sp. 21-594]MCW9716076.1 DUF5397 domain-containing protein [Avibacterium sp. 21-594]